MSFQVTANQSTGFGITLSSGTSTTGQMKVYTGSAWAQKPVKVWAGSAWTIKPVKFWDGSSWRLTGSTVSASPIVLDAVGPSSAGAVITGSTTLSWSHTCSGTNRYLVVGTAVSNGQPSWTTSATCNGSAMTSLGRQQSDNQPDGYVELFGIIPPTGSCTIVVTSNNTVTNAFTGGSISATGVDQTNPVRTTVMAYNYSASIQSGSVAGTTNDLFIDAACCGAPINSSTQTLRVLCDYDSNSGAGNLAMSTAPGASSANMGYNSSNDWWGIVAISLRAVGT